MFSKKWNTRDIALKQLGQIAMGCLILGVGEGRTGVVLSSHTQATTHSMLECCCSVLAYMCADPVYKVFVAGLVSFSLYSEIKIFLPSNHLLWTAVLIFSAFSTFLFVENVKNYIGVHAMQR